MAIYSNLKNFLLLVPLKFLDFILMRYNNKFLNKIKKFILTLKAKIIFIIEENNWAIEWVGKYITENLKNLGLIEAELGSYKIAKKKIIHFGDINCLFSKNYLINIRKSNTLVLTCFHIILNDKKLKYIKLINAKIALLHTSSEITKKKLIELGFEEKKIVLIPLGIDLSIFKRYNTVERNNLKKKFNVPKNKIIIGSFQKDGVGWKEGLKPKLIKGPDVFCDLIEKIHQNYDIHIFLTGPSRGYVKKRLDKSNIPYTHIFLKNYLDIVECYNVLDLYIITSRNEGGPLSLLESMATGVPIISTKVGMAQDIIENGVNGFITEIDNIAQLYKYSLELIINKNLRNYFIENGLKTIKKYSWKNITKMYYQNIYKKLLNSSKGN